MAIAFDTSGKTTGTAGSLSLSYTTGVLTNGFMVVFAEEAGATVGHITGCTYNSVAMTQIATSTQASNTHRLYLFVLAAPTSGTNNIVVSRDNSGYTEILAATYSGVNQASSVDSFNTGVGSSSTTLAISTTVVASNCWAIEGISSGDVINSVTNVGTRRQDNIGGSCGATVGDTAYYDTNGTVGTGSFTATANICAAANSCGIVCSIAPAAAAGAVTRSIPYLNLLGVGT